MAKRSEPGDSRAAEGGGCGRWIRRLFIKLLILVLVLVGLVGYAEYHTSRPEFCGSCHIMDPYYESWAADLHGTKVNAACVDCHYAPGERTTINAKLRGLSQVASYFSGRYGSTRPRAHVSNESCMTAKCHGDQAFMDKEIVIGTVRFKHANHLKLNGQRRQQAEADLKQLTARIEQALDNPERLEQLTALAKQAGPHDARIGAMSRLVKDWNASVGAEDLVEFSQLNHRMVRISQLEGIQCTNCHAYAAPNPGANGTHAAHHFTVHTTSCYTCHFNNEGFNTGTGRCLLCHTLPTGDVTIHRQMPAEVQQKLGTSELGEEPIKMDHTTIMERNVSCRACHADVASHDSLVTQRDCRHCHDQPKYFADWQEPFSLELVTRYHELHVPNQRAKCLDCHSEIHHQLVREAPSADSGFIGAAIQNCNQCHPNQHLDQINLLSGVGGIGVTDGEPNMMFGSRTNCYGCHTEHVLDERGVEVMKASENGCIACHGDKHSSTFEQWKVGLELSMTDADEAYQNAERMLQQASSVSEENRQQAAKLLDSARADLLLIKRGNGLHNVMYSMDLLDSVTSRCQQAMSLLVPAP